MFKLGFLKKDEYGQDIFLFLDKEKVIRIVFFNPEEWVTNEKSEHRCSIIQFSKESSEIQGCLNIAILEYKGPYQQRKDKWYCWFHFSTHLAEFYEESNER